MDDLSPVDRDLLTRTVLSEAGNQGDAGMAAVASVVRNRVQSGQYGASPSDVVLAPHQFSAWSLPQNDPNSPARWSAKSPQYQQASQIVDSVWSGKTPDQTGGADHYLNPVIVQAQKGALPAWAQGQPTAKIGGHSFYAQSAPVTPDLLGSWNSAAPSPAATPAPATPPAASVASPDDLLGQWGNQSSDVSPGTQSPLRITIHPQGYTPPPGQETPAQWTNRVLSEHQGNNLTDEAVRLGLGGLRGVGDVADTIAQGVAAAGTGGANALTTAGVIAPSTNAAVQNWGAGVNANVTSARNTFDAISANSPLAQVGRIGGQILGTAPLLGAGGAALEGATGIGTALAARPVIGALVSGAGAGGGAAALTSASSDQPLSEQIAQGAGAGALLGPIGYGASKVGAGINRALFGSISPETAQLAQAARDTYGIPVTAGQMSSSTPVRFLDSVLQRLPFSGYAARTAEQQTGLNRGVAATFGENSDTVTPQVIQRAKTRIGNVFDSVAQRTASIQADAPFYQRMGSILTDARSVLPASEVSPLENQMRDILSAIDPATHSFSGETYQALTRKGAPLDRASQSKDTNIRFYANQIRDSIDDAMQRSAPSDAVQDLLEARRQWRALKTVEPIASPKKAPTGDIRSALLATQASKSYPQGNGPLADLGRIGQRFIQEPPSSGTSERALTMGLIGTGLGALGVGGYEFDPEHVQRNLLYGGAALAGGRGASAILRSGVLANALIRSGSGAAGRSYPLANLLSRAAPAAALTYRNSNGLPGQ